MELMGFLRMNHCRPTLVFEIPAGAGFIGRLAYALKAAVYSSAYITSASAFTEGTCTRITLRFASSRAS